jgi:hypothetical protein
MFSMKREVARGTLASVRATGASAQVGRLGRSHRPDPGRRPGARQEAAAQGQAKRHLPIWLPLAVPELCQNPILLGPPKLLFERKQLPQFIDNKHFRIDPMERLEPALVLRNQQVAGSTPAGGSRIKSIT